MMQLSQASGTLWPEDCLKKQIYPCAVQAYKKTFFSVGENKFFLSANGLIEFQKSNEVSFSKGVLWVQSSEPLTIKNIFGTVQSQKTKAQVVVDASGDEVVVSVIEGSLQVQARADKDVYKLTKGHSVELGPVSYEKKAAFISLPHVVTLKSYLKSIEQVFPFSEFNFQEHIDLMASSIQQALRLQSKWNKTIVERKIANAEDLKVRQKYEREHSQRRDQYLRKLFRQKNNFED